MLQDLLSDKAVQGIVKSLFPQYFKTGRGRPVKKSLADSLKNASVVGKIALTFAGANVLLKKGLITNEHRFAIVAYALEHIVDTDLVHAFPSSSKWIVREALKEMGCQSEQIPVVTWDEVMAEISVALVQIGQAQAQAGQIQALSVAWTQAQAQGWKQEQFSQWLSQVFQPQQQQAQAQR